MYYFSEKGILMAKGRKTVADLAGVLAAEAEAIEKLRQTRQRLEKDLDSLAGEIAARSRRIWIHLPVR